MKNNTIFWGTFLITIGIVLLLHTLNFNLSVFSGAWRLWPLFIIFWGISLLKVPTYIKYSLSGLKAITLTIIISSILVSGTCFSYESSEGCSRYDKSYKVEYSSDTAFVVKYSDQISKAKFNIDGGAASFRIGGTTNDLITILTNNKEHDFDFIVDSSSNNYTLDMSGVHIDNMFKHKNNGRSADITLNKNVLWDLDFDIGAAELNADFSYTKVENVNIDCGAASVDLRFGSMSELTNVNIDAGAANFIIFVPKSSGCEIKSETGLTNITIDGFKQRDGIYYTENYKDATNKINISISAGVSSFKIIRE